jgi:NADPH-dependent 2,4-dienoyl-CoA reductase/sulfur reductase-like enzyme
LEGAEVITVAEKLPYSSGLPRNINQCLYDFDIPLLLNHTVVDIEGNGRLSGVTIAQLGKRGGIIPGSKRKIACDTLLLSVGLIPENELSREAGIVLDSITGGPQVNERGQTSVPGIFACGNVLQVHDIVDNVSLEAEYIVEGVVECLEGKLIKEQKIKVELGKGLRYVVPQALNNFKDTIFSFRVNQPEEKKVLVFNDGKKVIKKKSFRRVNPAEMIRVKLTSSELEEIKTLKVRLV